MFKRLFPILLLSLLFCKSYAQYIQYVPNPYVAPEPVQLPPQYTPPPMPPMPVYYIHTTLATPSKGIAYVIKGATINNIDATQKYVSVDAGIVFYYDIGNPNLQMSVVIPGNKSQSYGQTGNLVESETAETASQYRRTFTSFTWNYHNSNDGTQGQAAVTVIKEFRTSSLILFECKIHSDNGLNIDFTGVMAQ